MNLLLAALIAASATSASQWSVVVTRTGDVASSRVAALRESLVKEVEAQAACGLGTYVPPTSWDSPLVGRSELDPCTSQACLEKLANDIGVDRLIALRFNEGVERILVATSVSDVANGTLTLFKVTEVATDASEPELQRLAQTLCAVAPSRSAPTPSADEGAKRPIDAPYSMQTTVASPSSGARRDTSFLQKTHEIALPISAGVATSGLILSGAFMSIGAWQNIALRKATFHTPEELQNAIAFGKTMNTAAITSAAVAAFAAAVGTTTWFLARMEPGVSLSIEPAGAVHTTISGEF